MGFSLILPEKFQPDDPAVFYDAMAMTYVKLNGLDKAKENEDS